MIPQEIAVAAGALSAALLDSLVAKQILTKEEAAHVITNAMTRVNTLKGPADRDATLVLSSIAGWVAAR